MSTTPNDQSAGAFLKLSETLDLCAAASLTRELVALRGQDLKIDASDVRRVGGQCLQVLLSATTTWAADGRVLTLSAPSGEFIEGVTLLGAPSLAAAAAN
jgi:chemotaxis protein CheX